MIESEETLRGQRLDPEAIFHFHCHRGLECFNSCCRDKRLLLLPYDVLRLRRALAVTSSELLERHVLMEEDPLSGWPALRIKLRPDRSCPFVGPQGCTVYEHRPACCRLYPLTRAIAPQPAGPPRVVFLKQADAGCRGWGQDRELTCRSWQAEQGLAPYVEANDRLLGLLLHPRRRGRMRLTPRQTHAVILALYNLDVFRRLAADPAFVRRYDLAPERVDAAVARDEELLALGQDWLCQVLFGD